MPCMIWSMDSDSCSAASAIRLICSTDCVVSSALCVMESSAVRAISEPFSTALIEDSIRAVVLLAASALLVARLRTSSATTAKPLPAEPARAASTAALSARILVWKEISSIVLMI